MLVLTSSPIYINGQKQEDYFSSLDGNSSKSEILFFQKWFNSLSFYGETPKFYPLREDGIWGDKTIKAWKMSGERFNNTFNKGVNTLSPKPITTNVDLNSVLVKNPFKTREGLKTFQEWVMQKDPNILKKHGADEKWGRESSDAWKKYGVEYSELFSPEGTPIEEDLSNSNQTKKEKIKEQMDKLKFPFSYSLSSVGFALGIAYAVNNKTGFWKGLGYSLIFSIAGGSLGAGIDYLRKPKKDEKA